MCSEEILSYIYLNIYSIHELISNENLGKINDETEIPNILNTYNKKKTFNGNNDLYLIDNSIYWLKYKREVTIRIQNHFLKFTIFICMCQQKKFFWKLNDFKEEVKNIFYYIRRGKSIFQNIILLLKELNSVL